MLDHLATTLGDPIIVGSLLGVGGGLKALKISGYRQLIPYCSQVFLDGVGAFSEKNQDLLVLSMRTKVYFLLCEKGAKLLLTVKQFLDQLATLSNTKASTITAVVGGGGMLAHCCIVWSGLFTVSFII